VTFERILLGLNSVLLAAVGYLVLRAIARMDASLEALQKTDREQELAILELKLVVRGLENEQTEQRIWRREIGSFFASLGFRKADGIPPPPAAAP
jgi:hypothetical protein